MSDKDEIAALKARVEELEAKVYPSKSTFVPKSDAEWIDEMHQMRERRMNLASNFHPDDLRAMEAAAPSHIMRGIREDRHAPTSPSWRRPEKSDDRRAAAASGSRSA